MIVGDDCLVQVDPVQVNADPRVVVQMAVTHDDIAGSVRDVNCGSNFANQNACDRGLHDTDYLNPIGGRVATFDFDIADHWHAFSLPLFGSEAKRVGRLRMSRQQPERRAGAGHDDFGGSSRTVDRRAAALIQLQHNGAFDEIVARWELNQPARFINCVLNGLGVISHAVASGTEIAYVCHLLAFCDAVFR